MKKRKMAARILLTAEAYNSVERSAFKNCRTVSQELTYMVERQIAGKAPVNGSQLPQDAQERYDAPVVAEDVIGPPLPPEGWTEAQETEVYALGKDAGLGESQVTALRLIHKHFEAVKAAIEAEKVAA